MKTVIFCLALITLFAGCATPQGGGNYGGGGYYPPPPYFYSQSQIAPPKKRFNLMDYATDPQPVRQPYNISCTQFGSGTLSRLSCMGY